MTASALDGWRYAAGSAARVAWFAGHYLALRRMTTAFHTRDGEPFRPNAPWPSRDELIAAMRGLFAKDWANIDAGVYAPPREALSPSWLAKSRAFFRDARAVDARRKDGIADDVPEAEGLPRYYRQNFHFQSGGWLTEESARLYDFQVETLFAGTADAMRRQALRPIALELKGRDQRQCMLVDVACGTGRFLAEVKHNWPRLPVVGVDLSAPYLARAKRTLAEWSRADLVEGAAEDLPLPDAQADIVTCIYLFHELPPKLRARVAAEIARVLKPGGLFVLVDSLQTGDTPALDALLEAFPVAFHEPYYANYAKADLARLFGAAGLRLESQENAYLSKIMAFRKEGTADARPSGH